MDIFKKAQQEQVYDVAIKEGIYPYFHELESGQDT